MNSKHILIAALLVAGAARAEVVAVTAKNAPVVKLEQVCGVFLGKGAAPVPINLAEGNPVRDEFFRKACDKDAQQVKATWSKLIFTGKVPAKPKEVASQDEMKKLVAADPNAVGYLDKGAVDASLKIVAQ